MNLICICEQFPDQPACIAHLERLRWPVQAVCPLCGSARVARKADKVRLERGQVQGGEQGVDQLLQTQMLRDTVDYNGDPGIAVLLTGDGSGFADGVGFHADLERMHGKGWRIEVLSWRHSCNRRMREWAENVGQFIALDDYYESITFLEEPLPGRPVAEPRYAVPLDLERDPR